jgi:hypothetical protein
MRYLSPRQIGGMSILSIQRRRWSRCVNDGPVSPALVTSGHAACGVHGKVYEHRELPMWLLKEGIELLRYDSVVKALT